MKLISRIPAAVLAAMLVSASMLSCGDSAAQPTETQADTVAVTAPVTEAVENVPVYEQDDLPADLDFGGRTFGVYCASTARNEEFYAGLGEETGEVVEAEPVVAEAPQETAEKPHRGRRKKEESEAEQDAVTNFFGDAE